MSITPAAPAASGPSPILKSVLTAAQKGPVDAIVLFKPADTPSIASAQATLEQVEKMPLGPERRRAAFDALTTISSASIDPKMGLLEQLVSSGKATGVDRLWAVNAVRVRGASLEALQQLAGPDVKKIMLDQTIALPDMPNAVVDAIGGAANRPASPPEDPNAIYMDWGTKQMGAPAAWQQGITGAGIVIGSIDTGVISDHSGLKANYRGTNPDGTVTHDYNMSNHVEKGAQYPIDDVGHGTHTVGSALGNDARHLTGVAPDAKFIHSRGLGANGGTMWGLMAAMEWMMAPTDMSGKNPKPELAPDIITNSWGGGTTSNPLLWAELRNWRRAGIIPVFAAGNDRKASPGRVAAPGLYGDTITVGASDPKDQRAYFSMYGPSNFSKDRKPEIVAPGTKVYSTVPDGTFRGTLIVDGKEYPWSGTSMATPHVAGAIALYMQAHPGATYDQVLNALNKSGTLADKPNQEIGYGRVQVDKLIAPGTIDPKATLADPARVKTLMDQVAKAQVFDPPKTAEPTPALHAPDGQPTPA